MGSYLRLAELLESAAKALREAEKALDELPRQVECQDFHKLSVRTRKALRWSNPWHKEILTMDDLLCQTSGDLLSRRNFGITSLKEVREFLAKRGLALKHEYTTPEAPQSPQE